MSALIISTKVDLATDSVVQRLQNKGFPYYRINTEDYPFENVFAYYPSRDEGHTGLFCNGEPIENPTNIWYRRIRTPGTPSGMDEEVATFCRQEARTAIIGSILGQRHARWMSHPSAIWEAEYKPYQLQLAASLGLTIPRTVITNDPKAILTAFRQFGPMIIKPTRTGHIVKDGDEYAVYTSQLFAEHLDDLESARWSPAIYQQLIPKRYDLRVTIIGNRCFAAAIDSPSDPAARIDWRKTENPKLPHHPITLPKNLESTLFRLMEALRLTFGAIDLVETPNGEYVFLEVNPSGQWLWLDDMLGFGISDAIANWLSGENP